MCVSVLMEEREPVGSLCQQELLSEREREREGEIWFGSEFLALGHKRSIHLPAVSISALSELHLNVRFVIFKVSVLHIKHKMGISVISTVLFFHITHKMGSTFDKYF